MNLPPAPPDGARGPWRIVILVRRIDLAVVLSLLAHVLLFTLLPGPKPKPPEPAGVAPMNVVIATPPAVAALEPPRPVPETPAVPRPQPVPRVVPRPATPQSAAPKVPAPVAEPTPAPVPTPAPNAPPMDMLAMLEARRAQRRAGEAARAGPPATAPAGEDALSRNLRTLSGGEGVGGVFQVLNKGTRTGQFAFNGWKADARSQWREVIEVDAGQGGDIELAMVRRMIELIRTHYNGDFKWESHRLHRVVTLSARPEDQSGLEEFLMKEFFPVPSRG